ncbi:MAG: hypothetical protein IJS95_01585 [Prevotella sp.]|nr:hypothetical protein [Prevotella sp.]
MLGMMLYEATDVCNGCVEQTDAGFARGPCDMGRDEAWLRAKLGIKTQKSLFWHGNLRNNL